MRPEFIPREVFRQWLTAGALARHVRIDGILPTGYLARCERSGRPVRFLARNGARHYRLLDVIARARAECLAIEAPEDIALALSVAQLRLECAALTDQISARRHELALRAASVELTGATLLTEAEIAAGRLELPNVCGIYFLLRGSRVVYVGQARQVYRRMAEHLKDKEFDGFAFIPCRLAALDALESLYIHVMRPPLNGRLNGAADVPHAPMRLDELLVGNADYLDGLRAGAEILPIRKSAGP